MAVVGFDDIEECAYSTPSLTTVAPDKAAIAAMAVDLLAGQLDRDEAGAAPRERTAPHRLVERESTAGRQSPLVRRPAASR